MGSAGVMGFVSPNSLMYRANSLCVLQASSEMTKKRRTQDKTTSIAVDVVVPTNWFDCEG